MIEPNITKVLEPKESLREQLNSTVTGLKFKDRRVQAFSPLVVSTSPSHFFALIKTKGSQELDVTMSLLQPATVG